MRWWDGYKHPFVKHRPSSQYYDRPSSQYYDSGSHYYTVAPRKEQIESPDFNANFRNQRFSDLSIIEEDAAWALNYTDVTWDSPGLADIERIVFADLNDDETNAATTLGFTQETWDCYQNHYGGYHWAVLVHFGLHVHYEAFGFTETNWDDVDSTPPAWRVSWAELNLDQQAAALNICYFEELWDMVPIPLWNGVTIPAWQE